MKVDSGGTQIIIHGGAVTDRHYRNDKAIGFLRECCERAHARLLSGGLAIEVVEATVHEMELSGLFLAGKGAYPNAAGEFELDASIMDGRDSSGGGVACLAGARSAIRLAQRVRKSGGTMLVGQGIRRAFPDDDSWLKESPEAYYAPLTGISEAAMNSGLSTVGAAIVDLHGNCAAATATGGVIGKVPGRVGDTAIVGAGTWADKAVAVSCTGQGEYFIRTAAAKNVSARMIYAQMTMEAAVRDAIDDVSSIGGLGGIVAASPGGVTWACNTAGLKRAWVDASGELQACL